jgi:hypothetical protein
MQDASFSGSLRRTGWDIATARFTWPLTEAFPYGGHKLVKSLGRVPPVISAEPSEEGTTQTSCYLKLNPSSCLGAIADVFLIAALKPWTVILFNAEASR